MQLEETTRLVDGIIESGTVFVFLLITVLFLSNVASAGTVTYRWDTSNGVTIAPGVTTNWGSCGANPTSYKITELTNAGSSGCSSDWIGGSSKNPAVDMFFNTAYTVNTSIQGNWYYGRLTDGNWGGGTFTFRLIYVTSSGTIVILPGSASQSIGSRTDQNYNVSLTGISGTIPAGGKLGLRISTSGSSSDLRAYMGDTGGSGSVPTGYFSVTETPLGGSTQTYNLSGYVTNKTSGLPLSGATVQINNSLNTTTDATGFYNFTGISNGTYIINASLTGYATNSTTQTVNGNNIINANISLSPVPTYLLSGHVTNASSGTAISGATVTTNTGLTTSTDGAGYYSFTVSNGTYIVTATKAAYADNSTTKTINGASVSNADITLAINQVLQVPQVLHVQTSRFSLFSPWTNKASDTSLSANFTAYALLLDTNGMPVSGVNITFEIYSQAGKKATKYNSTQQNGLASVSYDTINDFTTSTDNNYGNWTIIAYSTSNPAVSGSTNMSIQAGGNALGSGGSGWGSGWGSGCDKDYCHESRTASTGGYSRSPYTDGYGQSYTRAEAAHTEGAHNGEGCYYCHPGYAANKTGSYGYTGDVHKNRTCDFCHGTWSYIQDTSSAGGKGIPKMPSCSDCHLIFNNNLTDMYTLDNLAAGNNISVYSYNYDRKAPLTAHNGTNYSLTTSVPCIVCHGPAHNTTKPDPDKANTNNITEYTQCISCHSSYNRHNNNVSCTVCHSQDAHVIKIFAQNATYITGKTNSARGNCTNCHQNSTFFNTLLSQPKAGNYSGMNPPQIPTLSHSTDPLNGSLWNGAQPGYWTNTSQLSACYYCHGDTKHNASALGNINTVKGTNIENQSLTGSTWCANCHYGNAPNYAGNLLNPQPPEVLNKSGLVPAQSSDGTSFFNHSGILSSSYNDITCKSCHNNNLNVNSTSLDFSHSVKVGSFGGPDCISCHYIGSQYHNIDTIAANSSVHFGMNSNNATNAGFAAIDGACWACHDKDGNVTNNPSNQVMGDIYNTPKKCDDCHLASGIYYAQSVSWGGPTVSEHYYNGSQIKAGNAGSDIASCINCHENVSEMILNNNDPDYGTFAGDGVRLTGGNMSFYHYGKPRSDLRTWDSGNSENCSYCHQNTSTAFAIGMLNPGYNSSIQNHSQTQASPSCYNSTCHNTGWIHNSTLTRPALNPGSAAMFCQNCHTTRQTHNGTLDCSNCHINQSSGDTIHPIKFIQNTGTFDTSRTQAANCTNCHQGTGVSGFDGAPKVPKPVNHSTSLSAGQKWGNYWNNASQITACYYCHQNEIHENNTDLLGNVSVIEGSNILNNPDLANSTWCANCHYAGAQDYKGNLLAISPPEITNSSLVASDGTLFFNHSGLTNFNDSNCKNCHGRALSGYSETSLNLSHSVSEGGGDNCIDCHGTNYIGASPSVAHTFVNISAFNESIHQNLNATPQDTVNNLDCWTCHYNKDMNRQNVKKCGDCHRRPSQWHGNANITTNLSELW